MQLQIDPSVENIILLTQLGLNFSVYIEEDEEFNAYLKDSFNKGVVSHISDQLNHWFAVTVNGNTTKVYCQETLKHPNIVIHPSIILY